MRNKSIQTKAHQLVVCKTQHGEILHDQKPIRSIGTERAYKYCIAQFLDWRQFACLPLLGPFMETEMHEYLNDQSEILGQSALDQHRQALQTVFSVWLNPICSLKNEVLQSKDLTKEQLLKVLQSQSDLTALSTLVCLDAGLRAHELLTLKPADIQPPSAGRSWRNDLFYARKDFREFTVLGKGGLCRRVAVSDTLAIELELYRQHESIERTDREIHRSSTFRLNGGQSFSQSFSRTSLATLGFSLGAHCLRHIFAKNRFFELRRADKSVGDALHIVSQECGHFRPQITLTYLQH